MDLHAAIPLVAFLDLVHLRIPLPVYVFGGAGRRDQGGINDRALPFVLLPGCGELVIREAELLATHHPSPGLRLQNHCPANGAGFP